MLHPCIFLVVYEYMFIECTQFLHAVYQLPDLSHLVVSMTV